MPIELIIATVAISLALLFYTWGVFGERSPRIAQPKYVLLFWGRPDLRHNGHPHHE